MRTFTAVAIAILVVAGALAGCAAKAPPKLVPPLAPNMPNLTGLRMIDAKVGWATGGLSVLRTDDGWASWAEVTPGRSGSGAAQPPITASYFLDATHAWVATGGEGGPVVIHRTADGGKTWSEAKDKLGGVGLQMSFADAATGFALVHLGAAAGSEEVAVMATTDGGKTWKVRFQTDPQGGGNGLPFGGGKSGLTFGDITHGWVTGQQPVEGRAYLYATSDGGVTWRLFDLRLPPAYARSFVMTRPPVFFSADEGLLPVTFGEQGQPTVFYATHDGGRTWAPGAPVSSPTNASITWNFFDLKHGFATDGGKLYATPDGGVSWRDVKPDGNFVGVRQVEFVSAQVGWAFGDGVLIKTTDGGKTWAPATTR
ncbi:MAG TPA: hypothetical protein VGL40_13225 [Bacillota bacterium]|jgi:photosystem II stability/assembly factor-like uncharacterized protein